MTKSASIFKKASKFIPGGVNSPVRAFGFVGGTPPFIKKGEGAFLFDEDDQQYIDYVCTWGATILGHANPTVLDAVQTYVQTGLGFGAPTKIEADIAEKICNIIPSMEMVRMVNSGTEATMSAIRLARGFTGRDKIIKFEGNYHGHSDSLLVKAGSGALTFGAPSSPGVPADLTQHTLTATYNDLDSVQQIFEKFGDEIACIILEPVTGNMNCVLPKPGFLQGLRDLCDQYNSVFIIDEVMTGFRVALGGAQEHFNIKADLTTLGKVIGAGMPVGAFGGKREIMEHLSPLGPVYQAGTLSGNHVAMAAGLTNLNEISKPGFYDRLNTQTQKLADGLKERADAANIPFVTNFICGMFGFFFTDESEVTTYQHVTDSNIERFKQFFHGMLKEGVFFGPSAFEAGFLTAAHNDEVINATLDKAEKIFGQL